jgi:hypothetical protein
MYFLEIAGRKLWPYIATMTVSNKQWPIEQVLYDTGIFRLHSLMTSWAFWLRESKSLLGKMIMSVDIINQETWEFFTLQPTNIFYFNVFDNWPVVVIQIGKELRLYENFWKTSIELESDGDKSVLVPLGYGSMFVEIVRKDGELYGYKPVILDPLLRNVSKVDIFWDYYGFKSYTDSNGTDHFMFFIEGENSTEEIPDWYWVDNFVRASERIDLASDQYVEEWNLDAYGTVYFTITNGSKYYIERWTGKMLPGEIPKNNRNTFVFTRVDEDTDSHYVVAKNDNGVFMISASQKDITDADTSKIVYFKDHIWTIKPKNVDSWIHPRFLLLDFDNQIVLVSESGEVLAGTDLTTDIRIKEARIANSQLQIILADGSGHSFLIT